MKIDKLIMSLALFIGMYVPGAVIAACVDLHPVATVTSVGGGQSLPVNKILTTSFRGHIMTTVGLTDNGRNVVKICPGTTVEYVVSSAVGGGFRTSPDCADRHYYGTLAVGETISCRNKKNAGGRDIDVFTVIAGR